MKFELYLAGRYFRGRRQPTRFLSLVKAIAVAGVAIGSAGLLISLSIVHGFKSVIHEKVHGFAPHITVHSAVGDPLFRADTLEVRLTRHEGVAAAQTVVMGDVMVQSAADVSGTVLKGVDPDGDLTDLRDYLVLGEYDLGPNEAGLPGIILGSELARSIGAEIGRTVTAYTIDGIPTPFNTPEIVQFHLSGVYETGIDRFDDAFALVDRSHARRLLGLGPLQATALDIRVAEIDRIDELHLELERALPFPYAVETIYHRYRNIFAWVDLQEQTIPFVISVMVIIAAFNLVGTVLMMVLERVRDIGILKTIGARNREIRRVFLLEGILVGGTGLLIGIGIAVLFNWLQATWQIIPLAQENYYMNYAPVEPHAIDFLIVSVVTLLLCALASWFPASFAAKTDPVQVLSFGR